MEKLIISVPDLNDSFSRVVLSGSAYFIRFTYNDTFDYWTFGVYDTQKNPIVTGIKIVPRFPLNLFQLNDNIPLGVFNVSSELDRIGRDDFLKANAEFCFIQGVMA